MKSSVFIFACKIAVFALCIVSPGVSHASEIEFVTKEKFVTEKDPSRNLPIRILFKKL
jgi:hypothetical protein